MEPTPPLECPYCGSELKKAVDVCVNCRRDIGKIIELQEELKKTKAEVEKLRTTASVVEATTQLVATKKIKPPFQIPLGVFIASYVILSTLLVTLSLGSTYSWSEFELYEIVFFMLVLIAIYVGIHYVSDFSMWLLALITFFLPQMILWLAVKLSIAPPRVALNSLDSSPIFFASITMLAGFLFTVFLDKAELKKIFGFDVIRDYLSNTQTAFEKLDKLLITVTTVFAAFKTISTYFTKS